MTQSLLVVLLIGLLLPLPSTEAALPRVTIGSDGKSFQQVGADKPFVVWGVNYDHNRDGQLIEDYWTTDWKQVSEDFQEIRDLGANVVRVHLQLGKFMRSPEEADPEQLKRLKGLIHLAHESGVYLNLTGLGCYHRKDVPAWYDTMSEEDRWQVQGRFWKAIASTCKGDPAIFCYDLMNEPIAPGRKVEKDWLGGELGGKFFVQRISLDARGRSQKEVARKWVETLTRSIREVDEQTLITVGVIPWAHVFPKAKPLFYSPEVSGSLDFVSVHFYPKNNEVDQAIEALKAYEIGKPLVIEEMFPLKCTLREMDDFIERSKGMVAGWTSFYWGQSVKELSEKKGDFANALKQQWFSYFELKSSSIKEGRSRPVGSLGNDK